MKIDETSKYAVAIRKAVTEMFAAPGAIEAFRATSWFPSTSKKMHL